MSISFSLVGANGTLVKTLALAAFRTAASLDAASVLVADMRKKFNFLPSGQCALLSKRAFNLVVFGDTLGEHLPSVLAWRAAR